MPETGRTKIVVPDRIQRGDLIRVQVVMQHPMDTGFFRDANANIIPAWFISDVRVMYGDAEVARFEWTSGVSRDPMVSFELKGADQAGIFKFMDALKLVVRATSLGDVHTMMLYPVMSSHREISPKHRERMGIRENLVRLSVGIEAVDDIIADLDQALRY